MNGAKSQHEAEMRHTRQQEQSKQTWDTIPSSSPDAWLNFFLHESPPLPPSLPSLLPFFRIPSSFLKNTLFY